MGKEIKAYCTEYTIDLAFGEFQVRLWLDGKEWADTDKRKHLVTFVVPLMRNSINRESLVESIVESVPNMNALQVTEPHRYGRQGVMYYFVPFDEDKRT